MAVLCDAIILPTDTTKALYVQYYLVGSVLFNVNSKVYKHIQAYTTPHKIKLSKIEYYTYALDHRVYYRVAPQLHHNIPTYINE